MLNSELKTVCHVLLLSALMLGLSNCASITASDGLYRTSEVGQSKKLLRCRVLASRKITIRSDEAGGKGEVVGFVTGMAAVDTLSPVVNPLVSIAGGLAGGIVGRIGGDKLHNLPGVEYTVILEDGEERTLVQNLLKGEKMLPARTSCRLQVSGSYNRVLPAGHLPGAVKRPRKVEFSN